MAWAKSVDPDQPANLCYQISIYTVCFKIHFDIPDQEANCKIKSDGTNVPSDLDLQWLNGQSN